MKKYIDVFEHSGEILNALKRGILITTAQDGKVNPMTIAWGTLGIEWGKPIFITFVREGRFTRALLDKSLNFTVNVPAATTDKNILSFCGTRSGREVDKVKELNLTLVDSDEIPSPAIAELPLTLECKVIYRQMQDKNCIPAEIIKRNYPETIGSENPLSNKDYHIAYYGEIVKAYYIV